MILEFLMKITTCCIKSLFTLLDDPLEDNLEREEMPKLGSRNTPLNLSMLSFREDQGKWPAKN
jgi:hypothetical protein